MALSNIKKVPLGNGLYLVCGDYTHTVGTTHETYAVESSEVYMVQVNTQATTGPADVGGSGATYSLSTSGLITTITFQHLAGISAGTFAIIYGA